MAVNLNLYKYFITVIEERSVTKAAIKMGVSQPTVTYNIKELERWFNEKLFTVGRKGIMPVKRAIILYKTIKPAYCFFLRVIEEFMHTH